MDDLTRLLREHASRHSVPGAAVGVLRGDERSTAYVGVGDVAIGEPVDAETRFAVGSLAKSMVARLTIDGDGGVLYALPLDKRTFLGDPADPDTPTVTFDRFDESGRPAVLYSMIWGLPRA